MNVKKGIYIVVLTMAIVFFFTQNTLASITVTPMSVQIIKENYYTQKLTIDPYLVENSVKVKIFADFKYVEWGAYLKITDSRGVVKVNVSSRDIKAGYVWSGEFWASRGETYIITAYGGEDDDYRGKISVIVAYKGNRNSLSYKNGNLLVHKYQISVDTREDKRYCLIIPTESIDSSVKVNWDCNISRIEDDGYFLIKDIDGNILVTKDTRDKRGKYSGSFTAAPGDIFIIEFYGGYDDDDGSGSIIGNVWCELSYYYQFMDNVESAIKTEIPTEISLSSYGRNEKKEFTIPSDSFDSLVKVYWECNLIGGEQDAYFQIKDNKGNVVVYSDAIECDQSGFFWARPDEQYTVNGYGGEYDDSLGTITGKIIYMTRFDYNLISVHLTGPRHNDSNCSQQYNYYLSSNKGYFSAERTCDLNTITDAQVLDYPIYIWWDVKFSCPNFDVDKNNDPAKFQLFLIDEKGIQSSQELIVNQSKSGSSKSGSLLIPRNNKLRVYVYTGDAVDEYRINSQRHKSFDVDFQIHYRLDEISPSVPGKPQAYNGTYDPNRGVYYLKLNSDGTVDLKWTAAIDDGPEFRGYKTISGIQKYELYVKEDDGEFRLRQEFFVDYDDQNTTYVANVKSGIFSDGKQYSIKIKAVDRAGNRSEFSETTHLIIDSIPPQPVAAPIPSSNPPVKDGFTRASSITWTWSVPAIDDLKEYRVYIQAADAATNEFIVNGVAVNTTSYIQTKLQDGKEYLCWVVAVDRAGNTSIVTEQNKGRIKVDQSIQQSGDILPRYPVQFNNGTVKFTWNSINEQALGGIGIDYYEVSITETEQKPVSGVQTRNNEYTFSGISGKKTYYAWVRAVDLLGNTSEWKKTKPFPNIQPIGPVEGGVLKSGRLAFNVASRYAIVGEEIRYKVFYQKEGDIVQSTELTAGEIQLVFTEEGKYYWWIETSEFTGGVEESGSKQISEKYVFYVDTSLPNGSFKIKSSDGTKEYSEAVPTKEREVLLADITLEDNSGQINSGIKGIYLWNGFSIPLPADARFVGVSDIPGNGIGWHLPDVDGIAQVNMLIEDNAGNTRLISKTVTLDRIKPGVPVDVTHTLAADQINFLWKAGLPNDDVVGFCGTYQLGTGVPVPFEISCSATKEGSYSVDISNLGANQPITIKIYTIDRAGNESAEISYTGYSPASLGELRFVSGGYDTVNNRHFIKWEYRAGIGKEAYLEYGEMTANVFVKQGQISTNDGVHFIHFALSNGYKLAPHGIYSYRLVVLNNSGDPTYGEVFTMEVPNQEPTIPELLSPVGFARGDVEFKFNPSIDYDGDVLTYTVYLGEGANPVHFSKLDGFTAEGLKHNQVYSWYVTVDDNHQGVISSAIAQFKVDAEKPGINIEDVIRPYSNQSRLLITAWDDLSGIEKISYKKYVDNVVVREGELIVSQRFDGVYQGQIDLDEGQYHLHFTVWDKAGNNHGTQLNNLAIDRTAPELTGLQIELPQANGNYLCSTGKVPVTWHGTDDFSGVRNLRYWFVSSLADSLDSGKTIPISSNMADYHYMLDIGGTNGKKYYLIVTLEDNAGNHSAYQHVGPILRDTTYPTGKIEISGLTGYGTNYFLTDPANLDAVVTVEDNESWVDINETQYVILNSSTGEQLGQWTSWPSAKNVMLTPGNKYQVLARVKNGTGLVTELKSLEFVYDPSAPLIINFVTPQLPVAHHEQVEFKVVAEEKESLIVRYRLAIGSTRGGTEITQKIAGNQDGWLIIDSNNSSVNFRIEIPEAEDGLYYPTIELVNAAGLLSRTSGNGIVINNSQERMIVNDQGPYTMFDNQLTGWWSYKGEQSVNGYRFRIISSNGQVIQDWQNTNETEVTVDKLNLAENQTYHFEVQAYFGDGRMSASGFSPGVTVDTTPAVVHALLTPSYATSDNLKFTWDGDDLESGISRVEVALGTDFHATDVTKGWVVVAGNEVKLVSTKDGQALNLIHGNKYYLSLRLINGAGNVTEVVAPGIIIDNTPPPLPVVVDQGSYINLKQPLEAHWVWSPVDPESGVTYEWAVIKDLQDLNRVSWNLGPDNLKVSYDGPREHGQTYYFAVKATNGAGLTSIGISDGIMIDATAPLIPRVVVLNAVDIGDPSTANELNYITSSENLGLWIDAMDLESGINGYQYAYGEREKVDQADLVPSSTPTVILDGIVLENSKITVFKGECFNGVDLVSQPGYSTGVMLDTGAPVIKNVRGVISNNMFIFDWDVEASASPVAGYEVALVPEAEINLIPKGWINVGLSRSVVIDSKELPEGKYSLLIRGYNRAGTYSRREGQINEWGVSPVLTLDRTAPVIKELSYPQFASKRLAAQVVAEDNLSGIRSYQYALGSRTNPVIYSQGWVDVNESAGFVEMVMSTETLPTNTEVYLMVRAVDNNGNWSQTEISRRILIDQSPPETPQVVSARFTRSAQEILGIQFSSVDQESGVTHYQIGLVTMIGGELLNSQTGPIDQFDGKLQNLNMIENGTYYVAIRTKNAAGDWSEVGYSDAVIVDLTPPELIFNTVAETVVFNDTRIVIPYTLFEAAKVQMILSGEDGVSQSFEFEKTSGDQIFEYAGTDLKRQKYVLTAKVWDLAGWEGIEKVQKIRINQFPMITIDNCVTTPGKPIEIIATVIDKDGLPTDLLIYNWNFGDGSERVIGEAFVSDYSEATGAIYKIKVTHRFLDVKNYGINLTATDQDGGSSTFTVEVKVENTTIGRLYANEVWQGIHRIYGDVIVPSGIQLLIKSDAQIIVDGIPGDTDFFHALVVEGSLIVENGVSFVSVTGEAGGWKGIEITGSGNLFGVIVQHAERGVAVIDMADVVIEKSIFKDNKVGIHLYNSKPLIKGTLFENNIWYGVKEDQHSEPRLINCVFDSNQINYYHEILTEITDEKLNQINGNSGNQYR